MRRAAVLALLVAATAPAWADPPPVGAPPPVAPPRAGAADWDARDLEGRWAAYRAAIEAGGTDAEWVPFLVRRRQWDLLEWVAIASESRLALDALAKEDAASWIRVAFWRRAGVDSHAVETGTKLLYGRAGLVLAWLERFPDADPEMLATLRAKQPAREDASGYAPPLDPKEVLRDLEPPADLQDLGPAPRAAPGARYVQQVERALLVLAQSRLHGEPWTGRLGALLSHPHPKVRRAAALAWAHRPPDELPLARFEALLADEKEAPAVRAAALLGMTRSSHPSAYARLVRVASDPKHPAWRAAWSRLGDVDDGYVLDSTAEVASVAVEEADALFRAEQVDRVRRRVASLPIEDVARAVPRMLERAAWVDLACDPCETTLVAWTLAAIRARLPARPVREAVEAARTSYEAKAGPVAGGATAAAVTERVRSYAGRLLAK